MRTQTNSRELDTFFSQFKKLEYAITIYEVESFLKNPNKVAPKLNSNKMKPLNLIIMSSIIFVLSAIFLSVFPIKKTDLPESSKKLVQSFISDSSGKEQVNKKNEVLKISPNEGFVENDVNITRSNENVLLEKSIKANNNEQILSSSNHDKDTIIWGNPYILKLSSNELKKLGFQIDETGIYYKNYFQETKQTFHSRFENSFGETTGILNFEHPQNKKVDFTNFDFYPVLMSNMNFEPRTRKLITKEEFEIMNDTLIAVELNNDLLKCDCDPTLIWFKYTASIFDHLPDRYSGYKPVFEKIETLKNSYPNKNIIYYTNDNESPFNIEFIELPIVNLQKLGFDFSNNDLSFTNPYASGSFNLKFKEDYYGISMEVLDSSNQSHINLLFLSDTNGIQNLKWKTMFDNPEKYDNDYFNSLINTMVPVIIRKDTFPDVLNDDYVFWFALTEDFLNLLPENLEKELRQEYQMIKSDGQKSNHTSD
ncbi:MAG: hypothetical protein R2759_12120 [Bacteroidales bacterium]